MNRGMLNIGAATLMMNLRTKSLDYSLKGIAGNTQVPTLIASAEIDPLYVDARPLYDAITSREDYPRTIVRIA